MIASNQFTEMQTLSNHKLYLVVSTSASVNQDCKYHGRAKCHDT